MSGGADSSRPNVTSVGEGGFVPSSTAELDVILDPYEFLDGLGRGNERRKPRQEESVLGRGELVAWFELPEDDMSRVQRLLAKRSQ